MILCSYSSFLSQYKNNKLIAIHSGQVELLNDVPLNMFKVNQLLSKECMLCVLWAGTNSCSPKTCRAATVYQQQ